MPHVEGVRQGAGSDTEVLWRAPGSPYDVEEQFAIVSEVVAQGIDGILLVPAGARTMTIAVRVANEAAIPILVVDSPLDVQTADRIGVSTLGFVGSDNAAGGALAARHAATLLPDGGRVAILRGTPGNASTQARAEGFRTTVKQTAGLALVADAVAYSERGIARVVTRRLLEEHPNLDIIFATNGEMGLGAADAVGDGSVRVIAFDGTEAVREAIDAGRITATVAQEPAAMGRKAVEILLARLESDAASEPVQIFTDTYLVTATVEVEP